MISDVQKGLLVTFIGVFEASIFFLMYKFGKRPIKGTKTFGDRMELFYTYTASFLLGQFFFQALPNATGPSGTRLTVFISSFMMLGFFIMLCIQKCSRVIYLSNHTIDIRSIVNLDTMEYTDYHFIGDLDDKTLIDDNTTLIDEREELKRRQRICVLTISVSTFLCIMEGFFLVYRKPGWVGLSFFFLDKILETFVISVSLLHAFIHANFKTYIIASCLWTIICIFSTIPILVSMDWASSSVMVNHMATSICYASAGGFLFWIASYYSSIDRKRVDKMDTGVRLTVFGITSCLAWSVGYFI